MPTRPELAKADVEAKFHEAVGEAEAKIALFFSHILHIDLHFSKKTTKFSVDFRQDFKNFGSKWALAWELY